jgi:hypothetical protein
LVPPSRADGGLANGELGLKINDVRSVTGVTSKANALNLLGIMSLRSVWRFINGGVTARLVLHQNTGSLTGGLKLSSSASV